MLTETEKAYLAGMLDADGCISITHCHRSDCRSPVYALVVAISQADGPFLERWKDKVGLGSVHLIRKAHTDARHGFTSSRDYYQWAISSAQAESLLQLLLPYIDIKRAQAQVALKFRQTKKGHPRGRTPLSNYIIVQREQCRQEMRALNRRGILISEVVDEVPEESIKQLALMDLDN